MSNILNGKTDNKLIHLTQLEVWIENVEILPEQYEDTIRYKVTPKLTDNEENDISLNLRQHLCYTDLNTDNIKCLYIFPCITKAKHKVIKLSDTDDSFSESINMNDVFSIIQHNRDITMCCRLHIMVITNELNDGVLGYIIRGADITHIECWF